MRPLDFRRLSPILLCALLWLDGGQTSAADWEGALLDGSRLQVDPATRRAWRWENGQARPLWDGVHRLEDGSVVIVREGTAVPTEEMLETWPLPVEEVAELEVSVCEDLVEKVCGSEAGCAESQPCRLAHQLLDMAKEERATGPLDPVGATSSDQCREAMENPFFVPCE